jgi:TolB-like protein/DNA-binding SARP family transcriptional activator
VTVGSGGAAFVLRVLGGASVEGPDGPLTGRVAQKRRLAVLALLAMSRRPGVSREKLAALVWPESDGDRARHLLSDSIYVVNRALGGEVIVAVADELRLQPDRLACDARRFEDAVERGALDEAARLYAGPFLDGFFIEDGEEFERWLIAERDRLHAVYARALERLAIDCEGRGDRRAGLDAWRRLVADDPLNSRLACRLADALGGDGDIGGAIHSLQQHAAALAEGLGIGPPQEVTSRLAALRATPPQPQPPAAPRPVPIAPRDGPVPLPADPPGRDLVPDGPSVKITGPPPVEAPPSAGPAPRAGTLLRVAVAAGVALALAGGLLAAYRRSTVSPLPATAIQAVGVLPFTDLSPGGDQQYVGDGVAEELTTRLGRVTGLKVAARTSAFTFRGADRDAQAIGRALAVDGLLEGSVRQAEGRVRIAVRLVDARTGYQIWTETWERGGRDVLALQDDVAAGVLAVIRPAQVVTAERPSREIDPAAYDLYLQGRYLWHQRTKDALTRAAAAFEQAVALAPAFAEAHSGVADAFAVLGFYDHLPPREAFPRARAAADRALAIDANLAEAHASRGYVALYYDWDWALAERELDRAIALNPSYSTGHQWRGNLLVARGRFDEAVAALKRAQEIDPLSLIASAALGWVYLNQGAYEAALQQCQRTIALNANFEQAWIWGGMALGAAGRHRDAVEMLERAATLSKRSPPVLAALGRARALAGDTAGARSLLAEIEGDSAGYVPAYEIAKVHLALGDEPAATTWLRRALEQRSHSIVFLDVDPELAALRHSAEFQALVATAGVAVGRTGRRNQR